MFTSLSREISGAFARPVSIHHLPTACIRKNGELRFVAMTAFQSASEKSLAGARRMMPALLMSASIRPVLARICAMTSADSFCVPVPRSALLVTNEPPAALTLSPVSARSLRATPTTVAPSLANATQTACPMPRLAPVTTTTLLLNRISASAEIQRVHGVHIIEHLVFPRHAPDEFVIARTDAEV